MKDTTQNGQDASSTSGTVVSVVGVIPACVATGQSHVPIQPGKVATLPKRYAESLIEAGIAKPAGDKPEGNKPASKKRTSNKDAKPADDTDTAKPADDES